MKKAILSLCAISLAASSVTADVKITFDFTPISKEVIVSSLPTSNLLTARTEADLKIKSDTITIINDSLSFPICETETRQYSIQLSDDKETIADFFAAPNDNITVVVTGSSDSYKSKVSGTPLLDGIAILKEKAEPIKDTILAIRKGENTTANFEETINQYYAVFEQFIRENPNHEASAYAMLNVDQNVFMELYDTLGEKAKQSLYYPFVESSKKRIEKQLEAERRQAEMQSGEIDAPNFSLPGLDGKNISLSDFKGKWVVLDFWGSWCGWCIKGFPKMKEAYAKHAGKVEFLGIDCGDTIEDWKAAVAKYQIPWVNVYNDTQNVKEGRPDQTYAIQGYPTKIIINPEGKIAKIVTGEDPQFYTDLDNFINQ